MAELNRDIAKKLWVRYQATTIDKFFPKFKDHRDASGAITALFLGFADICLTDDLGLKLKLRKIQVKLLKGGTSPMVDFHAEKVEQNGKTSYIPVYFPKTGETRAVITQMIFADERVKTSVREAEAFMANEASRVAAAPASSDEAPSAAAAGYNPFDEEDAAATA